MIRGRPPLYPGLIPAAVVLSTAISEGVAPAGFIRALLLSVCGAAFAAIVAAGAFRDWRWGGIVSVGLFVVIFSREPVIWSLRTLRAAAGIEMASLIFVVATSALVVLGGWSMIRGRKAIARFVGGDRMEMHLDVFGALFVGIALVSSVPHLAAWVPASRPVQSMRAADGVPDIYVLLLDAYPRADELLTQFSFDNTHFQSELEKRGFEVDEASHSNYTSTSLVLPSLLTMDYLADAGKWSFTEADLRHEFDVAQRQGAGLLALRQAGFTVVATSPGWEHATIRQGADRLLERPEISDFERYFLGASWIPDLPLLPHNFFYLDFTRRVNGILEDSGGLADEDRTGPLFAFIHVPAPHLPLAFDEGGNAPGYPSRLFAARTAAGYGLTEAGYARAYGAALGALNDRVLKTVDRLLADSAQPPVIVVMSDHGYDGPSGDGGPPKLRNFLAYHTPNQTSLLDGVTPVNLLRILLETYSGSDLGEELPDRYFETVVDGSVTRIVEVPDPG